MELPHQDLVDDVVAQVHKAADGPLAPLRESTTPGDCHGGPTFPGVGITADADLLVDGLLIDFKSTRHPDRLSKQTAWQLLGYFLAGCHADADPLYVGDDPAVNRLLEGVAAVIPPGHCPVCAQPLPTAMVRMYCSRWCSVRGSTLRKRGWLPAALSFRRDQPEHSSRRSTDSVHRRAAPPRGMTNHGARLTRPGACGARAVPLAGAQGRDRAGAVPPVARERLHTGCGGRSEIRAADGGAAGGAAGQGVLLCCGTAFRARRACACAAVFAGAMITPAYPLPVSPGESSTPWPWRSRSASFLGSRPRCASTCSGHSSGEFPYPLQPGMAGPTENADRLAAVLEDIALNGLPDPAACTPWEELRERKLAQLHAARGHVA